VAAQRTASEQDSWEENGEMVCVWIISKRAGRPGGAALTEEKGASEEEEEMKRRGGDEEERRRR